MQECKIENLYDLNNTISKSLLERYTYPWEVLNKIREYIIEIGENLDPNIYEKRENNIWIAKSAKIMQSAYIGENVIIGENTEIKHCAFIRENAIIGDNCIIRKFYRT